MMITTRWKALDGCYPNGWRYLSLRLEGENIIISGTICLYDHDIILNNYIYHNATSIIFNLLY